MMNKQTLKRNFISRGRIKVLAATIVMSIFGLIAGPGLVGMAGAETVTDLPDNSIQEASSSTAVDPLDGVSFPTFYSTGLDACTSDDGKPVIFLFSSSTCSHCEWVGDIFDFIAMYYVSSGSIVAHHYDLTSGDDLLTAEIETEIPSEYLQIKENGDPKGLVPYFNFNCQFERIGNGYEATDDSVAEAAEIRQVIESLIPVP